MQVILTEKVNNLGDIGSLVDVLPGHARNYLLPHGKAVLATEENKKVLEQKRQELQAAHEARQSKARARLEKLQGLAFTLSALVGEEDQLYGSVGPAEIVEVAQKLGVELEKSEILMPHGPIRQVGEHAVTLRLESDVQGEITITVVAEETA